MSSPALQVRTRVPRFGDLAVARARLHVVPRGRTTAPTMPFVMLVTLVLVGGVVSLLLFNTSMQQASFAASALEEQATTLTAREQTLQMELEDLRNPQRVAEQAQQMGMVLPAASGFLNLSDGSVVDGGAAPMQTLRLQARPPRKPAVIDPAPIRVTRSAAARSRDTGATSPATGERRDRNGGEPRSARD
jgi:cell division protein FtsB